jgi:hypothetical protein
MTGRDFTDRVLGRFSSHPKWLKRSYRFWAVFTLIPILLLVLVAVGSAAWSTQSLLDRTDFHLWFLGVVAVGAFCTAFFAASALITRWGRLQAVRSRAAPSTRGKAASCGVDPWIVVFSVALGCLLPAVVLRLSIVSAGVRFAAQLFTLLPLVGLLVVCRVLETRTAGNGAQRVKRKPLILLLAMACGVLWALTIAHDASVFLGRAEWARKLGALLPWYERMGTLFSGLIGFGLGTFLLVLVWRIWAHLEPVQTAATEKGAGPGSLGDDPQALDERGRPIWLGELLAKVPQTGWSLSGESPHRIHDGDTSPFATSEDALQLRFLFAGKTPTENQEAAVKAFVDLFTDHLKSLDGSSDSNACRSADILVEGEPGSGRSSALFACALYASLVRGQKVLLLVPDEPRVAAFLQRFVDYLRAKSLDHYVRADSMSLEKIRKWTSLSTLAKPGNTIPDIIIATPAMVQKCCFDGQLDEIDALRRFLLLLQVVLVDDILDLLDTHRCHLPFILDKHRLLLHSHFVPAQFVVVACPLSSIGRRIVCDRLFSVHGAHIEQLHRRPSKDAWRVDLSAEDIQATINQLSLWCMDRGMDALIYQRGIAEEERARQLGELSRRRQGDGEIRILSHLDEPIPNQESIAAIFYQVAIDHDICLALNLAVDGEHTVIFSLVKEGESREGAKHAMAPVLAGRFAESLMVQHLKSVLPLLRPNTPVPADSWYQFGIRHHSKLPHASAGGFGGGAVSFTVDDRAHDDMNGEIWPWISFAGSPQLFTQIDLNHMPEELDSLFRLSPSRFCLGRSPAPVSTASGIPSRAEWRGRDGIKLCNVELAHFSELRVRVGETTFVADSINQDAKTHKIEFLAKVYNGMGHDLYLPILDIDWELPGNQQALQYFGGPQFGLAWCQLKVGDRDAPFSAQVGVRLIGRFDDYGVVSDQECIQFSYDAHFSPLVFGPRKLASETLSEQVGKALAYKWETGENTGFRPALSAALNYALSMRLPGATYFARCLAFDVPDSEHDIGSVVGWLIEPKSTGNSVISILGDLLKDHEERRSFFESVKWLLGEVSGARDPVRLLHRFGKIGFDGDGRVWDTEDSYAIVEEVLRKTVGIKQAEKQALPAQPALQRDPRDFNVTPVVAPPAPVWETKAPPVAWEDVVQRPWSQAVRQFPDLSERVLVDDGLAWCWVVRAEMEWAEILDVVQTEAQDAGVGLDRCKTGFSVTPGAGMKGAAFRQAIVTLLAAVGHCPSAENHTLILRLWGRDTTDPDSADGPRPGDPVNACLIGSIRTDGLVLEASGGASSARPPVPGDVVPGHWLLPEEESLEYVLPGHLGKADGGSWDRYEFGHPEVLPEPSPGAIAHEWEHAGRSYQLTWGFAEAAAKQRYLEHVGLFERRITGSYFSYLLNDPYLNDLHVLSDHLHELYGRNEPLNADFVQYLLSFVQAFPYIRDPKRETDWPRFPSEYLLNKGGDCEDSSILFAFFLAKFGFEFALLEMANHLAVGVVGPFSGAHYVHEGEEYFYAETATNACYHPLGLSGELAGPAKAIPYFSREAPGLSPVNVLSATVEFGSETEASFQLAVHEVGTPLDLVVYSRPDSTEFDASSSPQVVGAVRIDCGESPSVGSVAVPLADSETASGRFVHDVVVFRDGQRVGRWYSCSRFVRGAC